MDGWGPTVRGAGSPRGVSARAPSSCCAQAPRHHSSQASGSPPLPATHSGDGPAPCPTATRFCPSGVIMSLGEKCHQSPRGGEHRGPTQLKGLEVALERVRLVGKPAGAGHSTRTCKLHSRDFETCESVYFIGWRWKNKAPAEAVEQNPPQQPLAGSCQLPFLQHSSAWDPARRRSAAPSPSKETTKTGEGQ